ncbi:MAG: GntR family transcriptional regulator [Gracilibacteraceae bacterium]|jgi:GntR family transcriptional regulator|nr:GntR family transcriptional regulator [Gracilibacteraceae bacterium]
MQLWEQWSLSFDDRMPIYRQIILQFSRAFVRGDIRPGERIPSIRELSVLLKVNTNTIQRVYQEMERGKLISSKRGTGYFFTEDENMMDQTRRDLAQDSLRRFVEEMRALGCADKDILDELVLFMTTYMRGDEPCEAGS